MKGCFVPCGLVRRIGLAPAAVPGLRSSSCPAGTAAEWNKSPTIISLGGAPFEAAPIQGGLL